MDFRIGSECKPGKCKMNSAVNRFELFPTASAVNGLSKQVPFGSRLFVKNSTVTFGKSIYPAIATAPEGDRGRHQPGFRNLFGIERGPQPVPAENNVRYAGKI